MSELNEVYKRLEKQKKSRNKNTGGEIVKIEHGHIKDFVAEENLDKFNNPGAECLQVHIKTPDDYVIRALMTVSSHPNSNMQRYFNKFGKYPAVGAGYPLEFKAGFWRPASI